jgi:hypothetical protein
VSEPTSTTASVEAPEAVAYSFLDLVRYALRLGTLGFGGPVALVGYMHRDLVQPRHWITEAEYTEGLAVAQLAPGPRGAGLCTRRRSARHLASMGAARTRTSDKGRPLLPRRQSGRHDNGCQAVPVHVVHSSGRFGAAAPSCTLLTAVFAPAVRSAAAGTGGSKSGSGWTTVCPLDRWLVWSRSIGGAVSPAS